MEIAVLPSKNAILIRAIVNIGLGSILLIWPGATLVVLVYAFALNILLIGLSTLFEPAYDKSSKGSLVHVILGLVGVVAGIFLVARPELTGEIIAFLIAIWAIIFGVVDIYLGFTTKDNGGNLLFVLVGVVSVIFGIYVLNSPLSAILDLVNVIGIYAIIVGIVLGIMGLVFYPKTKSK
ncbi:MAG: DUF308 domain-containing protein [bacterium]